ncbi:MAG: arylsulfatase [Bacteroidales bacterium]
MNTSVLSSLGLASLLFSACNHASEGEAEQNADKKNVILIMTDDQGYGDLGFTGNSIVKTPTTDSLAEESVQFSNFYVSPVSAPTRASLMTGRYSLRTGIYDTYNGGAIMANEEVTVAEILKDNGYHTGIFGKWHLGDNYPFRPIDQGFTTSLVHRSGGIGQVGDIANYFEFDSSYFDPVLYKNGKEVQTDGYCSDVYTEEAIDFIRENKTEPFFLYLSFNAPHTPLQLPEEYYEMYKNIDPSDREAFPGNQPFPDDMSESEKEAARKVYGMVTNIDDNMEKLFTSLEENGLEENTLIIFLTDNGPQQRRYKGGFRGRKSSVYEGGIHVPFLMKLGDEFPANKTVDVPAAHIDILPTILDICNISMEKEVQIDGKSLLPLIQGNEVPWADRPLYFYWQRSYPEPYQNVAVRKGNYKLVGHAPYTASLDDLELFNLEKDPYEQNNILSSNKEQAREFKSLFDDWYGKIMESPHLNEIQSIKVGSDQENPVILNRNDAKGQPGIWNQMEIYGYWDIEVVQEADYDIVFHFHKPLEESGTMNLRMGTVKRTIHNEMGMGENTREITMPDIHLEKGQYSVESWYSSQGRHILPFYVEIKQQ